MHALLACWLLTSGSFGFWLLACICYIFEAKIFDLRAICCCLEPICMPFWLLVLALFDSWLLVFGFSSFFWGFGFFWLLAFGRTC